jgi:hypothetical protein
MSDRFGKSVGEDSVLRSGWKQFALFIVVSVDCFDLLTRHSSVQHVHYFLRQFETLRRFVVRFELLCLFDDVGLTFRPDVNLPVFSDRKLLSDMSNFIDFRRTLARIVFQSVRLKLTKFRAFLDDAA